MDQPKSNNLLADEQYQLKYKWQTRFSDKNISGVRHHQIAKFSDKKIFAIL